MNSQSYCNTLNTYMYLIKKKLTASSEIQLYCNTLKIYFMQRENALIFQQTSTLQYTKDIFLQKEISIFNAKRNMPIFKNPVILQYTMQKEIDLIFKNLVILQYT